MEFLLEFKQAEVSSLPKEWIKVTCQEKGFWGERWVGRVWRTNVRMRGACKVALRVNVAGMV